MFAINWNSAENNNYHRFKEGSTVINRHLNISQITIQVIRIFEATKKIVASKSSILLLMIMIIHHIRTIIKYSRWHFWENNMYNKMITCHITFDLINFLIIDFQFCDLVFFCKSNIISSNRIKKRCQFDWFEKRKNGDSNHLMINKILI